MKIIATSDTHGEYDQLPPVPPCDIFIHAGDATMSGTVKQLEEFNEWLDTIDATVKFFVPGNHDWLLQRNEQQGKAIVKNAEVLLGKSPVVVMFGKIKIWGSPWTPEFHNWAFNYPRGPTPFSSRPGIVSNMGGDEQWHNIPRHLDILVTHGPPMMVLDKSKDDVHCGCPYLLAALDVKKPKHHIFGHIHESFGSQRVNSTLCHNVALRNGHYRLSDRPYVEINL